MLVNEGMETDVVIEETTGVLVVEIVGETSDMIETATTIVAEEMITEEDEIIGEVLLEVTAVDMVVAVDLGRGVLHLDVTMIETGDVTTVHPDVIMIVTIGTDTMTRGMEVVDEVLKRKIEMDKMIVDTEGHNIVLQVGTRM